MPVYVGPRRPLPHFPDLAQVARARGALVTSLRAAIDAASGDEACAHRAILILELHKACAALDFRMSPEPEGLARLQRRNGAIVAVIVALTMFITGATGFVIGDLFAKLQCPAGPAPNAVVRGMLA